MEKIIVMVNGLLEQIGSATARNVLRNSDMELLPISITPCGTYKKMPIDHTEIELIESGDVISFKLSPLFGHNRPDVIVDFADSSIFRTKIPDYLNAGVGLVLKDGEENFTELVKNLGVNIVLLPSNPSEKQILSAIRYLHQQKIFGHVFKETDIAA